MNISSRPASGMRDFLADDVRRRQWVMSRVARAYRSFGFEPLETPAIERLDVLTGKYGEEGDQLMFKLLVRGDKLDAIDPADPSTMTDLALHYDLTVPLARVYAQYQNSLPRFYKRYQMQPVWRADRPQKGRFREFYQCDVDYVGTTSTLAETEVLGAMLSAMNEIEFSNVDVRINDRTILAEILSNAKVETEKHGSALAILDKLDKIGGDAVQSQLRDDVGLTDASINILTSLIPALMGPTTGDALDQLASAFEQGGTDTSCIDSMRSLLCAVNSQRYDGQRIIFDPTLVRGMGYYTGPIFEFSTPDFSGSIAGGGRYDGLIGMFSGRDVPAVGGSLGLERILVIMEERGAFSDIKSSLDVLFVQLDDKVLPDVVRTAADLRAAGFSTSVYPESTKLGKQFKYAESIGARYVAILGSRELEAGVVEVKDLETGNQEAVPADQLTSFVKRLPETGGS